jgi:hypothetical protein
MAGNPSKRWILSILPLFAGLSSQKHNKHIPKGGV